MQAVIVGRLDTGQTICHLVQLILLYPNPPLDTGKRQNKNKLRHTVKLRTQIRMTKKTQAVQHCTMPKML